MTLLLPLQFPGTDPRSLLSGLLYLMRHSVVRGGAFLENTTRGRATWTAERGCGPDLLAVFATVRQEVGSA